MESKRITIMQSVVCIIMVCLIWGGYFIARNYGIARIIEMAEDDFSWVYQVDKVEKKGKEIVLSGFAFQLEVDSQDGRYEIVLCDTETGKYIFPKMEYKKRDEVNKYFLCEYDYLYSGYEATFPANKLELQEKTYEVFLKVRGEKKAYQIGTYLSKGELVFTNPEHFVPLEVLGTDLQMIVENGVLRVYRPDYGIYVYQYEGDLYWIAEPGYGFVDGDTIIQYQLSTTQAESIPQQRLENGWNWDNIGFYFSKNELIEWNTGKYRVAKKSIPTEYSVTKIWTGNYNDGWIWIQNFRPYYQFQKYETK